MFKEKASNKVILRILACAFLIIPILSGCATSLNNNTLAAGLPELSPGYYNAEYEGMTEKGAAFLACGTGGRLDRIFEDGTLENIPLPVGERNLTNLLIDESITLVGGLSGALVYSHDGKEFKPSIGAEKESILGLAEYKDKYYACTFGGNILSSADGITWETGERFTRKPLIAIATDGTYIMAITNDTDIFKSEDGVNWEQQNYNEAYEGLVEEQSFINMVNLNGFIYILGKSIENPDAPSVMFTVDGGENWMYTASHMLNDRSPDEFYPLTVYSLRVFGENMLAACDRGRVLTFTDCPSCNRIMETSNTTDLRCIAVNDSNVLVAGDDFGFAVLTANDLQDS